MDKQQWYYLTERNYDSGFPVSYFVSEEQRYWEKMLGKELLGKLVWEEKKLSYYFAGADVQAFSVSDNEQRQLFQLYEDVLREMKQDDEHEKTYRSALHETEGCMGDFYIPFLELSEIWLARKGYLEILNDRGILESYQKICLSRMLKTASRTLVFCMHQVKAAGLLKGNDSREEYQYYCREFLESAQYVKEVCENYPVLQRTLLEIILWTGNLFHEAVTAFWKDRDEINREFFASHPVGKIVKIEGNLSDPHHFGRGVLRLHLDNGNTVLYKPHSLKNEIAYHIFINRLYQEDGLSPYCYQGIGREDFGWCVPAEHGSCQEKEQVHRYYRRLGIQLFACYVLNMGDIHYENLIASGEYPVIVDFETLPGQGDGNVLTLGFLPCSFLGREGGGINISAATGRGGERVPLKIPVVVGAGTSDMHVVYVNPVLKKQQNLPKYFEKEVEVRDYLGDLCSGFEDMYHYAIENRRRLEEWLLVFSDCQGRYLFRNTQKYSMILQSSYHPEVMEDAAKREILLRSLGEDVDFENPRRKAVFEMEIKALLRGDIPVFHYKADSLTLSDGDGGDIRKYFDQTAAGKLVKRLGMLSEEDLQIQLRLTKMSVELMSETDASVMNTSDMELYHYLMKNPGKISDQQIRKAARMIGSRILEEAVYEKDHTKVNWYNALLTGMEEKVWSIRLMDRYLYNGLSGLAVFFHALRESEGEEYAEICDLLDKQLFMYTDAALCDRRKLTSKKTGAYVGEGSVAYAYQLLYQITGKELYLKYAIRHCTILDELLEQDKSFDILEGNAGAALLYLNMEELTGESKYLKKAEDAAVLLLGAASAQEKGIGWIAGKEKRAFAGYSHGNAGIMTVFGRLYGRTGKELYRNAVEAALAYENSLYREKLQNWLDCRGNQEEQEKSGRSSVAWCHGSPGILLSRLRLEPYFDVEEDIERAFAGVRAQPFRKGYCLCHGNCGNMESMRQYLKKHRDEETEVLCNSFVKRLTENILNGEDCFMPQEKTPGLMNGLAGIGYFLLEQVNGNLPCVL